MKKIIVSSHERSGTHFLMNTIAHNFGYLSHPWIDLDSLPYIPHVPANMFEILKLMAEDKKTERGIVKSHFDGDFFIDSLLKKTSDKYHIFYMYRDQETTLRSCWKHFKDIKDKQKWNGGTYAETYEEYADAEPWGAMLRYQYKQHATNRIRLEQHQKGWLDRKHVICVKFEDLDNNFNNTVNALAIKLDMPLFHGSPLRPTKAGTIQEGIFQREEVLV